MLKTAEALESLVLQNLIQSPEQTEKLKHYLTPIVREIVQEIAADVISREVGLITKHLDEELASALLARNQARRRL